MFGAAVMIAQHIAGKATRDALFLTYFEVDQLPKIMMASAAISIGAAILMSRLLSRSGPGRLMPIMYLISAGLLVGQWFLTDLDPKLAAACLYLQISALNSILISGFWSLINERFDPHSAKRVITRLTAATTFGGLVGGIAANAVATAADTHAVLLMLSLMHLVCGLAISVLARGHVGPPLSGGPPPNFLEPLKRSPLIRRMALLALLVATTAAVLDYVLKAEASASLSDADLITFFSYFYMAVGLGTFLVQSVIGDRALRWFGLGGTMAAWPLAILISGASALVFRSLVTATLMRASANLFYNSFFRAGFEVLYTPIPPADKRTGKILIDVGADRSGDLLGGLLIMLILMIPVANETLLLLAALMLAGICLLLILLLHRNYVRQLARNLRSGRFVLEDSPMVDPSTGNTLALPPSALERDQVLREIASTRNGATATAPAAMPVTDTVDPVVRSIMELRSGSPVRVKRVLASQTITPELLPHVLSLLADDRFVKEALRGIRRFASTGAGQLVDALLTPTQHPLVRRRLPLAMAYSDSPLAVEGLVAALTTQEWNVRYRCAQALETIHRLQPGLRIPRRRLLEVIARESRYLARRDASNKSKVEDSERSTLQLIFLLLGAVYDPETVELSQQALQSGDARLRGTALEYLENRVPAEIWARLGPLLARVRMATGTQPPLRQAARDRLAAAARQPETDATNPGTPLAGDKTGNNGPDSGPAKDTDRS